ncbi:hypothetical protein B296_00016494 [Ensete ventricosum]|uniref:Uncharacterized protein n=1 Tax=Ensete ventricosum TaxID=4639 RepID=A0A427AHW3_ENSVE|nr:hypothetical protein B296_00016494 [Ensete ventricosum]
MRFACFPSKVIAPLRKVETSLGEVRPPLISFIALVVRGHFYISCLSLLALIPPFLDHRTEESCPSGSKIGRSDPSSSSSGIMTLTDVRAFKALEIMKSCHDFDSTILPEEVTKKAVEASDKRLTEASGKHLTDTLSGQQKKAKVTGRHKSRREGEGSKSRATKCKKLASPVDKTLTPKARPKSVREL